MLSAANMNFSISQTLDNFSNVAYQAKIAGLINVFLKLKALSLKESLSLIQWLTLCREPSR